METLDNYIEEGILARKTSVKDAAMDSIADRINKYVSDQLSNASPWGTTPSIFIATDLKDIILGFNVDTYIEDTLIQDCGLTPAEIKAVQTHIKKYFKVHMIWSSRNKTDGWDQKRNGKICTNLVDKICQEVNGEVLDANTIKGYVRKYKKSFRNAPDIDKAQGMAFSIIMQDGEGQMYACYSIKNDELSKVILSAVY